MMSNLISVEESLQVYQDSIAGQKGGSGGDLVFVDGSYYHNEPRNGREE